ncbi:MAG: hypothetical protein H8M99_12075 [Gloeobacteraceae cyanobacterium ES-bin-144]|nr:hypothetical protein [Verrucomicrobiales bacterium]
MIRKLAFPIFLALFSVMSAAPLASDQMPVKVYPTATDPSIFDSQVESLLRATLAIGDGFGGVYDRELENRARQDPRDWESTLAKIIGNPEEYGFELGEAAISVVKLRGSFKNDKIVASCEVHLEAVVKDAMSKRNQFESRGEKVPHWVPLTAYSFLMVLLDFHDPRILHMLLQHLSSDEVTKLGMLNKFVAKKISVALRACGDGSHRNEVIALAKRFREAGQEENAVSLEKWAQHAGEKKLPVRGESEQPLQSIVNNSMSIEANETSHAKFGLLMGFACALVVIAGGFMVWRHRTTK